MAGVLAANGGTNSTAATLGGVGYGTGSAHAYTPVGIAGQVPQLEDPREMTDQAPGYLSWLPDNDAIVLLTIDGIVLRGCS
jgi:hypothetical protein